ncbi:MAG: AAA family ATPase [Bacteroidales bacterium]|nr:AAA family ATPase [Bacteroidales bacterium]
MKTFLQLSDESKNIFNDCKISMCRLLFAWIQLQDEALYDILKLAGISYSKWVETINTILMEENDPIKKNELKRINISNRLELTGLDLIKELCRSKDAPDHIEFINQDIDLVNLGRIVSNRLIQTITEEPKPVDPPKCKDISFMKLEPEDEEALLNVGYNLTNVAASGRFDDYSYRQEIILLVESLLSYNKSNCLIPGPAGVGKSAMVEYFAREMVKGKVPERLKNHHIYNVNIGSIISNTKWRGDFEKKLEAIIEAYYKINKAILFMDEFASIIGAGKTEGSEISVISILLPYLAREDGIKVIGATTTEEYEQYLKPSTAFMRRFTVVELQEPSHEAVLKMAQLQCKTLENYHGVKITDKIIDEAYSLSDHLEGRFQPDKIMFLLQKAFVKAEIEGKKSVGMKHLLAVLNEACRKSVGELMEA